MRDNLSELHPGLSPKVLKNALEDLDLEEEKQAYHKLLEGIPLAYVLQGRFFFKGDFYVNKNVLIPRMESELILEILTKRWKKKYQTLLDVGTGSGCLGLSCAMEFESLKKVILMDISYESLEVARINRDKLAYSIPAQCSIEWEQGDCRTHLPRADVIISNPPYIKRSQAHKVHCQVSSFEPHQALFLEDDDYEKWYQDFFSLSEDRLAPDGLFVMEGESDALSDLKLLFQKETGITEVGIEKDLTGRDRFLWGKRG